jgi:hypothetical protein
MNRVLERESNRGQEKYEVMITLPLVTVAAIRQHSRRLTVTQHFSLGNRTSKTKSLLKRTTEVNLPDPASSQDAD